MSSLMSFGVLILSLIVELSNGENASLDCLQPWTAFNITSNQCECGNDLYGVVQCNSRTLNVSIQDCYCMTYSSKLKKTLLNYCFFTCHHNRRVRHHLVRTNNVTNLNEAMCKDFNRTGVMCGECIAGHAPPVYSYSTDCVECKDYKYSWIKYIAVAYLPLTLFYIVIVLLKISVNSASMMVYVTVSQIASTPSVVRWYVHQLQEHSLGSIVIAPLAIWNLDFFRVLYQPFCLHPTLSQLQVTCLDYIIGVYPLLLIFMTYFLVQFYDKYIVISTLWKPLYRYCFLFRREWNIRESLIGVFATFIVLSYVKILNVSLDILMFNRAAYEVSGKRSNFIYLAINGSMPYLSQEHIPYAVLAIAMLIIFNGLPLVLLCVYPCSYFQKCLNLTGYHLQLLHTFMDTFQGCFREKPRDCRYFAGFYVFLRAANLVVLSLLYNPLYIDAISMVLVLAVALLAVCRPYKDAKRGAIDVAVFVYAIICCSLYGCSTVSYYAVPIAANQAYSKGKYFFVVIVFFFPLYGIILMLYQAGKCCFKMTGGHCLKKHFSATREEEPLLESINFNRVPLNRDVRLKV